MATRISNYKLLLSNNGPYVSITTHLVLHACFVVMTKHMKPKESGCGQ